MAKATTSLREVKGETILTVPRDHYGLQNWSIMTDGYRVWISKQKSGEGRTNHIEVPKGIFDRLLPCMRSSKPRASPNPTQPELTKG